uniref:Proteoglycan 4b n=1 Tax=Cyprinus carpio TaxID=7962 RepID=A0A8C2HXE4_CYPCA
KEDPTSTVPTEGPISTAPTEGTVPNEGPTSTVPNEGPTRTAPTKGPSGTVPHEGPTSTAPKEDPTSTVPKEDPTSTAPTEGPTSTAPAEGPISTDPRSTPVPSKTPSSPVPVKPTKKPSQPSMEKNDKSEPKKTPKDPSGIAPTRPAEKPLNPTSDKNGKTNSIKDYQADDYDTNLCSGRPVSGLTTLRNGTIVVFRGHYFWTLDKHRNPDPPQLITSVWGIPSPIDTVYTRCNCQGKTYFFKGKNYWRFENAVMDPGFPKPISTDFGQIGHITAALSIPQYRSRKESVIFFKRGYFLLPAAALGQVINISKTWRGFPTMVTSAVSVPSRVKEGYKYYVFTQNNYYSIKMEREIPVILKPATGPKENSATSFFKCPETQKN